MTAQEIWLQQRNSFLEKAKEAGSYQELVSQHRMLFEIIKMQVASSYPHEDTLRQAIVLLFQEAQEGAEFLLAQGQAEVSIRSASEKKTSASFGKRILFHPFVVYILLAAALVFAVLSGDGMWKCALLIAAAAGLLVARPTEKKDSVMEVKTPINIEYVDTFITSQIRLLDQHIEDIRLLFQDAAEALPGVTSVDEQAAAICQYVWGNRVAGMPTDQAFEAAEEWLRRNGLSWQVYDTAHSFAFDVLPTRGKSCTFCPAILSGDGTVIRKGQYLKGQDERGQ